MDTGQVFLLEEDEDLATVVFKRLAEFHREMREKTKHCIVGHVYDSYKERIGDSVSTARGCIFLYFHLALPIF